MSDYIASVDAGNGGTNAVLSQPKGYKSFYEPSVRAAATKSRETTVGLPRPGVPTVPACRRD